MGSKNAMIVWVAIMKIAGNDRANARIVKVVDSRYSTEYVFEVSTENDSMGVAIWRKYSVATLGDEYLLQMILGIVGNKVE